MTEIVHPLAAHIARMKERGLAPQPTRFLTHPLVTRASYDPRTVTSIPAIEEAERAARRRRDREAAYRRTWRGRRDAALARLATLFPIRRGLPPVAATVTPPAASVSPFGTQRAGNAIEGAGR